VKAPQEAQEAQEAQRERLDAEQEVPSAQVLLEAVASLGMKQPLAQEVEEELMEAEREPSLCEELEERPEPR
jgi:hypothetical protein